MYAIGPLKNEFFFFGSQAIFLGRCLGDFWPKCHFLAFLGWFDDIYEPFVRF